MKRHYKFDGLLQNKEWITPAYVSIEDNGLLLSIDSLPKDATEYNPIKGFALPGMVNAHSHAFQYAMAGLAERHPHSKSQQNFWTWRNTMYQTALQIAPQQLQDIATMVYSEMLRMGFTHVVEFHYLHHQNDGSEYENISELGIRLLEASQQVGIKITLTPIFYKYGNFGKAPSPDQRRFISRNIKAFNRLLHHTKTEIDNYPLANLGVGAHSLRAAAPSEIIEISQSLSTYTPFHIHASEQLKEVNDAIESIGSRPVEWLLNNLDIIDQLNLVHCTHLTSEELNLLAKSQANVVLCPSTEGNLADGFFKLKEFESQNGSWSIGTDSHIGLSPFEELRLLDYGQRLCSNERTTFSNENDSFSGDFAFEKCIINGRRATGHQQDQFFQIDQPFDALVIDSEAPLIHNTSEEHLLNRIIYTSDPAINLGTMVNGEWTVENNRHKDLNAIRKSFNHSMKQLMA